MLITRMEPIPLTHIMNCTTSREMWKKLQSVYERESNVSVHLLYQQFYSLKFEDNMNTYLTAVNNLVATLRQRGEELPKKMVMTKIIMTLPDAYKHFISAWESVSEAEQTLEKLTSRLLIEEERLNAQEGTVALAARKLSTVNTNIRRTSHYRNSTCENCGIPGHAKQDCRKRIQVKQCNYCKKKGHWLADCWYRKKKNQGGNFQFILKTCYLFKYSVKLKVAIRQCTCGSR